MEVQTMSNPQANVIPANIGSTVSKHLNNTSRARSVKAVQEGTKSLALQKGTKSLLAGTDALHEGTKSLLVVTDALQEGTKSLLGVSGCTTERA
jgi:hypothetical protein